jgi:hypothetical protein
VRLDVAEKLHRRYVQAARQLDHRGDAHIADAALRSPDLNRVHPGEVCELFLRQIATLSLRLDVAADRELRFHSLIIESRADGVQSQ